jgi:hypothetical protein
MEIYDISFSLLSSKRGKSGLSLLKEDLKEEKKGG